MDGQVTGTSHSDSQPLLWMTVGRSMSKKSDLAFSSRNLIEKGVGLEEVDAPERRGFRVGVDLRLGAIEAY